MKKTVYLLLALLFMGCADPQHDPDEIKTAVKSYSHSMLVGDTNGAWALISNRCKEKMGRDEIKNSSKALSLLYHDEEPLVTAIEARIENSVRTEQGEFNSKDVMVSYEFPQQQQINQLREPWTFEGDGWRNDEC